MDPRDLLPPPEHPYFVSSKAKKSRDKKIEKLQSKITGEDADFLYCFRKNNQHREILLEEFFILFDRYDYIPIETFKGTFNHCRSYFQKKCEEKKVLEEKVKEEPNNITDEFKQLHKTLELNNHYD